MNAPVISSNLVELVYLSAAVQPFTVTELRALMGKSRRNNRALDVTGLLVHADGSFLQVLEGPADAVDALYDRIAQDARHHRVVRRSRQPLEVRSFPMWSMGFVEPVRDMRTEMLGFARTSSTGAIELPESTPARIRELVEQFGRGRWRQTDATDP
jgi:hypothetical protein